MSVQVGYRKQVLLGIIFLIIIFAVSEFALRAYEIFNPPCNYIDNDVFQNETFLTKSIICIDSTNIQYETAPFQKLKPNQHFSTININSDGFRGPELDITDKKYRIFFLGGSSAFGMGSTSDNTTIPSLLEQKFHENDFSNIEIINAGVGGTISFEEKLLAENNLMDFNPELFIIYDGGNDVRYRITDTETLLKQESDYEFKFGDYPFYRTPFVITKILNNLKQQDIESGPTYNYPDFAKTSVESSIKEQVIKNYIDNWKQFCQDSTLNNVKTIIVLQPILGTSETKLFPNDLKIMSAPDVKDELEMLEKISNNLYQLNDSCYATYDLRNVFDNVNKPIFYDQIHVSDFGNELIANKIYENILPKISNDLK